MQELWDEAHAVFAHRLASRLPMTCEALAAAFHAALRSAGPAAALDVFHAHRGAVRLNSVLLDLLLAAYDALGALDDAWAALTTGTALGVAAPSSFVLMSGIIQRSTSTLYPLELRGVDSGRSTDHMAMVVAVRIAAPRPTARRKVRFGIARAACALASSARLALLHRPHSIRA